MKKVNKVLLSSLGLFATIATAAATISCKSRFDQKNDGLIKVSMGFSETGDQGRALKQIVEAYNDWLKDDADGKKKAEGYMPAEVVLNPNGYETSDLNQKLKAKDKAGFYNLITNYPAAASLVASYDMNLSVSDEDYDGFGIAKAFKDVNSYIAGNSKNEKWVVPISRSSEMAAVNKFVFGKMIKELVDLGAKLDEAKNPKLASYKKWYEDSTHAAEKTYVDDLWKDAKSEQADLDKLKAEVKDYQLTDATLDSYVELIKVSNFAKRMYKKDSTKFILGIDSIPNAINSIVSSLAKGVLKDMYITPDANKKKTGGWDYESFLNDKNSKQYKIFKEAVDILLEGIRNKSVWIGGGGAYASDDLKNHKMAMSIGSTAGFAHTYYSKGGTTFKFTEANYPTDVVIDLTQKIVDVTTTGDVVAKLQNGSHTNEVYAHTFAGTLKKYAFKSLSQELTDFLKAHNNGTILRHKDLINENGKVYLKASGKKFEIKEAKYIGKMENMTGSGKLYTNDWYWMSDNLYGQLALNKIANNEVKDGVTKDGDVTWNSAPKLAGKNTGNTNSVFTQGPSFVGIHANEAEDKATKLFIRWFYKHKFNITFTKVDNTVDKTFNNVTPLDAFNLYGSYISPTEEFFKNDTNSAVYKSLNQANKIAFDNFKEVETHPDTNKIVEDVASNYSNPLRKSLETAGKAAKDMTEINEITFENFVSKIKETFSI